MNSIFIFRRDFRIYDNIGLLNCFKNNKNVIPLFIFTPEQITNNDFKSDNAVQFMIESLKELNEEIKLNICFGHYIDVLKDIIKTYEVATIYTNTDYTPYAKKRDEDIEQLCNGLGIILELFHDITLFEPNTVFNKSGQIYQKFTPFYNNCLTLKVVNPKKNKIYDKIIKIKSKYSIDFEETKKFYKYNKNLNVNGGRKNGLKIISLISKFKTYENTRNILSINTTHLSAYLKFGCLSVREVFHKFKKKFGLQDPLIRQLLWREFYYHLGYGFIEKFGYSLKDNYNNIKWVNNKKNLELWKQGNTGYPIIDACMQQINKTGYMHNRGRLLVASFLIKNLGIDWRKGEKYFAQSLVDYDVLVNNGNWQWVSGSGADSQQYIRVFNPSLQSERYDEDCEFIKYWLPNLKDIKNKELHYWHEHYHKYDLKAINYYKPIVDYIESKKKTMEMYKKGLTSS